MKWGILATGNIAKKFASTINQMSKENEQLVAVGSRNIENAKAFANEHDIPRYYDSYEALVKDQDVEAVYVATPNTLHYENCRLCLEHGKHVLCEKPFTINDKQAQELYRQATNRYTKVLLGVLNRNARNRSFLIRHQWKSDGWFAKTGTTASARTRTRNRCHYCFCRNQ
jgi:predicted dehydrogenase